MGQFVPHSDTSIGGGHRVFPSTCWSQFAFSTSGGGRPAALENLAKRYWKPIYTYIRVRWSKSNEESKDLTQDFFAWMLESDFVARADPGRGRFRAFVKVALEHYLCNEHEKRTRQKRGGGLEILALETMAGPGKEPQIPAAGGRAPGEILDEEWKSELLLQAAAILEERLIQEGKRPLFEIFRDAYQQSVEVNYRELAAKHGVGETEVYNALKLARKRCREIVIELVSETVQGEPELRDEMRALFGEEPL